MISLDFLMIDLDAVVFLDVLFRYSLFLERDLILFLFSTMKFFMRLD